MIYKDLEQMVSDGRTSTFQSAGSRDRYQTWVRTTAACQNCGKRGMDRAIYYGLKDIDGDDFWLTEMDCGCKWK